MGLLQPLPIPDGKFEYCTIGFMTDLPDMNEYNVLMVIVDKFSKLSWPLPCRVGKNQLTAQQAA